MKIENLEIDLDRTVPHFVERNEEVKEEETIEKGLVEEKKSKKELLKLKIISSAKEISEYLTGFLLGLVFSLLSYSIIPSINKSSKKKRGILIGCITSFAVILTACLFFMCYTRSELLSQREWRNHHKSLKHYKAEPFLNYVGGSIGNIAGDLKKTMSVFSMSEKHVMNLGQKRKSRMKEKTKRSISAIKNLNRKIRYHLRRLL